MEWNIEFYVNYGIYKNIPTNNVKMEQIKNRSKEIIENYNIKILEFTNILLETIKNLEDEELSEYKDYFEECEIENLKHNENLLYVNRYCRNILFATRDFYLKLRQNDKYKNVIELIENFFSETREESINYLKNIKIKGRSKDHRQQYSIINRNLYSDNLNSCLEKYGYYYNYLDRYNRYLIETCIEILFDFGEYYEEYYDYEDFSNGLEKRKYIDECISYLKQFNLIVNNDLDIYGNKGFSDEYNHVLRICLERYAEKYDSISAEEQNKIEECIKKVFNLKEEINITDFRIFQKKLAKYRISNIKLNNTNKSINLIDHNNKFDYYKYGLYYYYITDDNKTYIEKLLNKYFNITDIKNNIEFQKGLIEATKSQLTNIKLNNRDIYINLVFQSGQIDYKLYGYYFNEIGDEYKDLIKLVDNSDIINNEYFKQGQEIRKYFDKIKNSNEELYCKLINEQEPVDINLFLERYGYYYDDIKADYKDRVEQYIKNFCKVDNLLNSSSFIYGKNSYELENIELENGEFVSLINKHIGGKEEKLNNILKLYGYYYKYIKEKYNTYNLIKSYFLYNNKKLPKDNTIFENGKKEREIDDAFDIITNIELKKEDKIITLINNEKEYNYNKCLYLYGYYYENINKNDYQNIENSIKIFFNLNEDFNIINHHIFKIGQAEYQLKKSIKINNSEKEICLFNGNINRNIDINKCIKMYGYYYENINGEDKKQIEKALELLNIEDVDTNYYFIYGQRQRKEKNDSLEYLKHITTNNGNIVSLINSGKENDAKYCVEQYGYYYENISQDNRQLVENSIKVFFNIENKKINITQTREFKKGINNKCIEYLKHVLINEKNNEIINLINEEKENDLEYCLEKFGYYYNKIKQYEIKDKIEITIKTLFNYNENIFETKWFMEGEKKQREEQKQQEQTKEVKKEFIKNFNEYILQFSSDKQIKPISKKEEIEGIIKIYGENSTIFEQKLSENNTNINDIFDNFEMYFNKKGIQKNDLEQIYNLEKEKNIFNITINNIMYNETNSLLSVSNNELFQFVCNLGYFQCDLSNIKGNVNNKLLNGQEYIFKGSEKFYGCDYEQIKFSYINGFLHLFKNVPIIQNQQEISYNIVGDNLNCENCLFQLIYYENNIENSFKEKLKNGFKNIFNIDVDSKEIKDWYLNVLKEQVNQLENSSNALNQEQIVNHK